MARQWDVIEDGPLRQGEYIKDCLVPMPPADFGWQKTDEPVKFKTARMDSIVITQSCDLENRKVQGGRDMSYLFDHQV